MNHKIPVLILSLVFAVSALGGCAPVETPVREPITFTEEELSRETKLVPNPELTGKLTVRYHGIEPTMEIEQYRFNAAFSLYREYFPNVDLQEERIDFRTVPSTAYQSQLATELMAGSGPDITFISLDEEDAINPYKMMEAGAFLDLTDYFRNDPNCNPSDFNQAVLDAGRYEGHQYLFPLYFRCPLIITTEEIAEQIGFHPENCTDLRSTWEELLPIMEANPMDLPEKSIVFSLCTPFETPCYTGLPWINYETKEVHLDDPKLKEYCEFVKGDLSQFTDGQAFVMFGSLFYPLFERESVNFVDLSLGTLNDLTKTNFRYLALDEGGTPLFIPWRTVDGGIEVNVTEVMGVCANTQNPEAAYQMIRLWYSPEFFTVPETWGHEHHAIPSRYAMEAYMEQMKQPMYVYRDLEGVQEAPGLSQDVIDQYMSIYDGITSARLRSPDLIMVQETLQDYYNGERSYESCISELQSKLEIYVTE